MGGEAARRWGIGGAVVLVIGAAALTVGADLVRSAGAGAGVVETVPTASVAPMAETPVYVHVDGAVRSPGLYRMGADARVVDAIAAAGGFADDAETAGVNLARAVSDGEQILVPREGEEPPPGEVIGPGPGSGAAGGKVNINTADATGLDTLPRVGPAIAARIIAWREEHGRFTAVEDLLAIPGIGPKMLDGLRDLVTL